MNDLITQMFCTGIVPILFDAHKYVYTTYFTVISRVMIIEFKRCVYWASSTGYLSVRDRVRCVFARIYTLQSRYHVGFIFSIR